jgi:chromosome partitioning protein
VDREKPPLPPILLGGLQLEGLEILLVDSDPQGSARDWAAAHEEQPVPVVGIDRPIIDKSLKSMGRKDFIVIDGAPQIEALAVSAIKSADFILIPVQPSPYDVWATSDLVDLVKARIEIMDGRLQAAFVISRAIKGTNICNEITSALADYGLPVLTSRITQRVIYPTSAATGQTVFEREPDGEAAHEIQALIAEIKQLLK